jgi:hypothetical protein
MSMTMMSDAPASFFEPDQYVLRDTAYSCCFPFIVTPYKMTASAKPRSTTFNWLLAQQRIVVEHTIGILKARYPVLEGLRDSIRDENDLLKVSKNIVCSLILHNMCVDTEDTFEVSVHQNEDKASQEADEVVPGDWSCEDREELRTCVQGVLLSRRGFY